MGYFQTYMTTLATDSMLAFTTSQHNSQRSQPGFSTY